MVQALSFALGVVAFAPSLIEAVHIARKLRFPHPFVHQIVLLAHPLTQFRAGLGADRPFLEVLLKVARAIRAGIKSSQCVHKASHVLLLVSGGSIWIPCSLIESSLREETERCPIPSFDMSDVKKKGGIMRQQQLTVLQANTTLLPRHSARSSIRHSDKRWQTNAPYYAINSKRLFRESHYLVDIRLNFSTASSLQLCQPKDSPPPPQLPPVASCLAYHRRRVDRSRRTDSFPAS
jgi:hypothetical protein